jgi:hypothetical protein
MAETDIAMPESTAVDSRPAFAIIEELKTKFGENFFVQTLSRISRQFGLSAHVYKKY